MITSNKDFEGLNTNNKPETYFGLSTDEKPITAVNGSCFIEMDTSTMYFFDEEAKEWSIWSSSGGGGGGGGSSALSELTDVDLTNPTDGQTLTYNATSGKWENGGWSVLVVNLDMQTMTLDRTWKEINDAEFSVLKMPYLKTGQRGIGFAIVEYVIVREDVSPPYYVVSFGITDGQSIQFSTYSEDGYPVVGE